MAFARPASMFPLPANAGNENRKAATAVAAPSLFRCIRSLGVGKPIDRAGPIVGDQDGAVLGEQDVVGTAKVILRPGDEAVNQRRLLGVLAVGVDRDRLDAT